MNTNNINLLIKQIQCVILNKSVDNINKIDTQSSEMQKLQEIIQYLSNCLAESNEFLQALCTGSLDIKPPSRNNFLAGNLKELHSVLKHLTWQTTQVAHGDYKQRVHFLGEFSSSFNLMVKQLEEREIELNEKSSALAQSMNLLVSIMDTQKDWIVVIDSNNHNIIYTNQSANEHFYNKDTYETFCKKPCPILEKIKDIISLESQHEFEYFCDKSSKYFKIISYPIEWEGKKAIVHYLSDITLEKRSKENLSNMAYRDELTGVYNRRYCIETIKKHLENKEIFSLSLIDLDKLKYVNDTFGHNEGDEYIKTAVHIIKNNIRETDVLCRIGGDEFVILLKNCEEEAAISKMNTIYNEIIQIEREYPLSISYGVTHVTYKQNLSIEDIFKSSDKKMYEFKNRNKKITE